MPSVLIYPAGPTVSLLYTYWTQIHKEYHYYSPLFNLIISTCQLTVFQFSQHEATAGSQKETKKCQRIYFVNTHHARCPLPSCSTTMKLFLSNLQIRRNLYSAPRILSLPALFLFSMIPGQLRPACMTSLFHRFL